MTRLRDLREDMDLRQIDVSKATGIDQKTLSNYETGKTNPDSFTIIKLAEFFNVSCDYLLGRTDTKTTAYEDAFKRIDKIQNELDKLKNDIKKL